MFQCKEGFLRLFFEEISVDIRKIEKGQDKRLLSTLQNMKMNKQNYLLTRFRNAILSSPKINTFLPREARTFFPY